MYRILFVISCLFVAVAAGDELPEYQQGDVVSIGERQYRIAHHSGRVSGSETPGVLSLWKDGRAWIVDARRPDLKKQIECNWPIITVSADLSLAVVEVREKDGTRLRIGVADLRNNKLLVESDHESLIHCRNWIFSPMGRFVYPLDGNSKGFVYFDLFKKELTQWLVPDSEGASHQWSGCLNKEGEEVCLLESIHRGARHRLLFPISNPSDRRIAADTLSVERVIEVRRNELICQLHRQPGFVAISTDSWKTADEMPTFYPVLRKASDPFGVSLLVNARDPSGKHVYHVSSQKPLRIIDRESGKEIAAAPDRDGRYVNAFSIGATFNTDGKFAAVATPYQKLVTVMSSKDHKPLKRFAVSIPISGVLLIDAADSDEGPGTCLVLPTRLPYE